MSYTEQRHAILGVPAGEPLGLPGLVATLPDNYLPFPGQNRSPFGTGVAAGAAGIRSEIALSMPPNVSQLGIRIDRLWIALITAAQTFEIVVPDAALSGFTDAAFLTGDRGNSTRALLRVSTKNTAAATTATFSILIGYRALVADQYYEIPGQLLLRAQELRNAIIIRPAVDQCGIRVLGEFTALEKRSL